MSAWAALFWCAAFAAAAGVVAQTTPPSSNAPALPSPIPAATTPNLPAPRVASATSLTYLATPPVPSGDTTLDLYFAAVPPGAPPQQPAPIVVFVHGGGWRRGDKAPHAAKGERFAREGYVFASINYRLHPAVDVATQALDVAQAVSWVARNAETYDADPTRVLLMGHSAGAHLAALVALDPSYFARARFPREHLRGVVLLDGAGYDLLDVAPDAGGIEPELFSLVFGDDPDTRRRLSPLHAVGEGGVPPPFLALHVPRERSRIASQELVARLQEAGGEARAVETPGKTHQTINQELGRAGDEPTDAVLAFAKQVLAPPALPQ
jgi:acetyl esterase/lipase